MNKFVITRLMKKSSKGFTLIELLVVIAIIGILAAIILIGMGSSRDKANNAKIKEQLNSIRNAAELYYANPANKNYGKGGVTGSADCAAGAAGMAKDQATGMVSLMTGSNWPDGTGPTCSTNAIETAGGADATSWSAYKSLTNDSKYGAWCVDSTGASKGELSTWTAPTAGAACP